MYLSRFRSQFQTLRIVLPGLALLILFFSSAAYVWDGKCVGVADGDTITVMHYARGGRIRLYGVDTPERGQNFGKRAKQFTSDMVFGKIVTIEPKDTSRYGRTVAMVYIDGPASDHRSVEEMGRHKP